MIYEIVRIKADPERVAEYEAALDEAKQYISATPGFISLELCRSVEEPPGNYVLIIRWKDIKAHLEGFLKSPQLDQWRSLVVPFYPEKPTMGHYEVVVSTD